MALFFSIDLWKLEEQRLRYKAYSHRTRRYAYSPRMESRDNASSENSSLYTTDCVYACLKTKNLNDATVEGYKPGYGKRWD